MRRSWPRSGTARPPKRNGRTQAGPPFARPSTGMQVFSGQHMVDWSLVFSGMLLASLPLLVIYVLVSRQLVAGLTAGAVKG